MAQAPAEGESSERPATTQCSIEVGLLRTCGTIPKSASTRITSVLNSMSTCNHYWSSSGYLLFVVLAQETPQHARPTAKAEEQGLHAQRRRRTGPVADFGSRQRAGPSTDLTKDNFPIFEDKRFSKIKLSSTKIFR